MAKGLRRFRYTRKKGRGKALLLLAAALFTGGTALSEWGLGSISEELTQEAARAYVLAQGLNLGVMGVWYAMIADWLFRGTVFIFRWAGGKWKTMEVI